MASNPYEQYLENAVLTATPIELVRMLYRCATEAVSEAIDYLQQGDIAGRAKPVSKALDALTELLLSLDHTRGGQVAGNLANLYSYMQQRILEGHCQQVVEPFIEVRSLLQTLMESWNQVGMESPADADPGGFSYGEPASEHSAYSYSG